MELSNRQIEAVSGLCAGFSTTMVTHPLDLVKVRLQLSPEKSRVPFDLLRDVVGRINELARARCGRSPSRLFLYTIGEYYRGISPNLLGNIAGWGLYFTLYAEFKSHLATPQARPIDYFASSALAGVATSVLTNPIWVLKTRILGLVRTDARAYKLVLDGVRQILAHEGVASFWKGTIPSMFGVLQASLQFTLYDHMKGWTARRRGPEHLDAALSTAQYIYISAASKIASSMVMYPTQVVRARLQNHHGGRQTIASVVRHLWTAEGGVRAFYKGVSANMLRVVPATCVTLVVYENVRLFCKRRQH